MHRSKWGVLALALLLVAGCAALQRGTNIVKYEANGSPIMTKAPGSGNYALYASSDVASKVSVPLKKGDPIGFKKDKDGKLWAVAGADQKIEIKKDGTYYWKKN